MQDLLIKMYFKPSKGILGQKQFKAGIAVSIKSTIALYNELKSQGVNYLLTTRIKQDCLENLFSNVRFMGGNDCHPSAKDFFTCMRNICLSKNIDLVINKNPVEFYDKDEFFSSSLIDGAGVQSEMSSHILKDLDDQFEDFTCDISQGRDYVAGYITKKLDLQTNKDFDTWNLIHFKGEEN